VRRLVRKRTASAAEGVFVAEGVELVRAALEARARVESVFVGAEGGQHPEVRAVVAAALDAGSRVFDLAPGVLAKVAGTVTPQPLLAVVAMEDSRVDDKARLLLVCANLRDPGNLGTVIRTADAVGADGVVCCGDSVDPFNPKAVRATAGSIFHVPVVLEADPVALLGRLGAMGVRRVGAVAHGGDDYSRFDWTPPTALVLGNEVAGLPAGVAGLLDAQVSIALAGRAESLNVGVAAAVLCFEALRQRRSSPGEGSTMPGMSNGESRS
jgi:RNA methyltransferase, TrmH family